MVILFKACPRCDGDVDTTYRDDIYCVQCGHRPDLVLVGMVPGQNGGGHGSPEVATLAAWREGRVAAWGEGIARDEQGAALPPCPKCGSAEVVRLDKLRSEDHTCYRCRRCGHIYSPTGSEAGARLG